MLRTAPTRRTTFVASVAGALLVFYGAAVADDRAALDPPETVHVPAGAFIAGSDAEEREYAYRLDEAAYGHSNTREWGWYDDERPRGEASLPAYEIMRTPVTQARYRAFVAETGHRAPQVGPDTWEDYGLIHPYERTAPYRWDGGEPPGDRLDHPVVMVSLDDARAYAEWLSARTGETWRLPTRLEWEKAARGTDGRYFPWSDDWDPHKANTHDAGPFGTVPVGSYPDAASPYGMLDAAGQVFEWTGDPAPGRDGRHVVKGGGSWDDKGCGICRAAAWHSRPDGIKHILVGFRLVREAN